MLHHHRNSHEFGVVVSVLPIPRKVHAVNAYLHLRISFPWIEHGFLSAIDDLTAEHFCVLAHTRKMRPRRNLIWFTETASDDDAVDERIEGVAESLNGLDIALCQLSSFIDLGVFFTLICDVVATYLEHY